MNRLTTILWHFGQSEKTPESCIKQEISSLCSKSRKNEEGLSDNSLNKVFIV